jgi:sigma-70-like protein
VPRFPSQKSRVLCVGIGASLPRRAGREAFILTQLLGLPYAEAAEVSDCPVGTLRSRVSRARATLMDLLDEADEPAVREACPSVGLGGVAYRCGAAEVDHRRPVGGTLTAYGC